jgi:hypothetical protein
MRFIFSFVLLAAMALSGCASFRPPPISYDDPPEPALLEPEPPKPVQVVEIPKLLPLPGQLKPLPGPRAAPEPRDPRSRRASTSTICIFATRSTVTIHPGGRCAPSMTARRSTSRSRAGSPKAKCRPSSSSAPRAKPRSS